MLSLWLIALHMLGDFILQNQRMADNKFKCWMTRTEHVFLYTIPLAIFAAVYIGMTDPRWATLVEYLCRVMGFTVMVFVLHWITDCRRWASDKKWILKPFFVDQTLHLLQLAICGSIFLVPHAKSI